jgi:hypothetical protein
MKMKKIVYHVNFGKFSFSPIDKMMDMCYNIIGNIIGNIVGNNIGK